MKIKVIDKYISTRDLELIADTLFSGEMVKAVVDIKKRVMAVGGLMHSDEEAVLLDQGSDQDNLWGINIYPDSKDSIEFDSMINIRPHQNNRTRSVEDLYLRTIIREIVSELTNNEI